MKTAEICKVCKNKLHVAVGKTLINSVTGEEAPFPVGAQPELPAAHADARRVKHSLPLTNRKSHLFSTNNKETREVRKLTALQPVPHTSSATNLWHAKTVAARVSSCI